MTPFKPLSNAELADYTRLVWAERVARRLHLRALEGLSQSHLARRKLEYLRSMPRFDELSSAIQAVFGERFVRREAAASKNAVAATLEERRSSTTRDALRAALGLGDRHE